jgi:putative ABC transport system permease protein
MFKNYLITALRNFKKNKIYSFINIAGLALGLTCAMLIMLWVHDELSYDRYNQNGENVYRLLFRNPADLNQRQLIHYYNFKDLLLANNKTHQILNFQKYTTNKIEINKKVFSNEDIYFADSEIIKFFDLQMSNIVGEHDFNIPFNVLVSENYAKKLFNDISPIGKSLKIDDKETYTIVGVFKDLPTQAHHKLSIVISFNTLRKLTPKVFNDSGITGVNIYFYANTENDLLGIKKAVQAGYSNLKDSTFPIKAIELQPLFDIHLNSSDLSWDRAEKGNILYVIGLSIAALLILLLACFNYINLSISKNIIRFREVAVRKVFGANKRQIISQFVFEALLYSIISFTISLVTVELLLPSFNNFTSKVLTLSLFSPLSWSIALILFVIIIIASIYPAYKMSSYLPSEVFKNNLFISTSKIGKSKFNFGLRQALVLVQFSITIFLLSSILIINSQMRMVFNSDLGFNKENIVVINNPYNSQMNERYHNFKNIISQYPNIISIGSGTNIPPANINNYTEARLFGLEKEKSKHIGLVAVDEGYFKTLESKFAFGRNFILDSELDKNNSVILNEEAVKELGIDNPLNKQIEGVNNTGWKPQTIIGVVKDLYFKSMYEEIKPIIFYYKDWSSNSIIIKISNENILRTMKTIENSWNEVHDGGTFNYQFMDENFDKLYKNESIMLDILQIFVLVAIVISSLGLLGMVVFTTSRKAKEIGIRKILGSSTIGVFSILAKELIILLFIANIIAVPITFFLMNEWLQDFAYKIRIEIIPFVISGLTILLIAFLTISFHTVKAAVANPVDSLRDE